MFSRLLCHSNRPPRSIACRGPGPASAASSVREVSVSAEKMPLVIRTAGADLALEENVDTLSLPYGLRSLSCAPTRRTVDFQLSERSLVTPSPRPLPRLRIRDVGAVRLLRSNLFHQGDPRVEARWSRSSLCRQRWSTRKPASAEKAPRGRRELMLNSSSLLVLGGLLDNALGGVVDNSRPSGLGLAKYSDEITLTLCPNKPNCVSTTDDLNDDSHYIPPWTYNPDEGRGIQTPRRKPRRWMSLLTWSPTDCDGFETTIGRGWTITCRESRIPGLGSWTMLSSSSRLGTGVAWNTEPRDAWIRRRVRARRSGNASKRSASRCKRRGGRASVSKVSG